MDRACAVSGAVPHVWPIAPRDLGSVQWRDLDASADAGPGAGMSADAYQAFLEAKAAVAPSFGFEVAPASMSPFLILHQPIIVEACVRGGRRAVFARFGLGKTVMNLEIVRICAEHERGRGLIILPLGVKQEFVRDALEVLRWPEPPKFIRSIDEAGLTGVYLTNYETVRDGKIDPRDFVVVGLDEADVLRGFGGTKTFRELMATCAGDRKTLNARERSAEVKYRFVFTATPSPNDLIELLAYAAFLGVMDVGQAKTRWFQRNSEKADELTLRENKAAEFWAWVGTWAIFCSKPSDINPAFSDAGYEMPDLDVRWHEIPSDHSDAGTERDGQGLLFRNVAISVSNAAREKRESLPQRVAKLLEIRAEEPAAHRIIWHDLEREREAIESAIPAAVSVYGNQDLDEREQRIIDFSNGKFAELAAKPSIAGSGCNFQRHCSRAVFLGIGFRFKDLIQSIHRIQRYKQTQRVRIDLIYTEAERDVRRVIERKWHQHRELEEKMTALVREHGLSNAAMVQALKRSMGVERVETSGTNYTLVNNDCVPETAAMADASVDMILTSIPFSSQYEYSPNFADFGHSDNNAHFWQQMRFLIPNLLRVLKPGRVAAIHVKDRIVPMPMTGLGSPTVYPFHADCIREFQQAGFAYMGMKTIVTDVVRENNQTYRLGWTRQCEDGSSMGCGMPEYLLLFRRPPTDCAKSAADVPVVKSKERYTRARWQIDAHGFARSSGNRAITAQDLAGMAHDQIFNAFRDWNLERVYDFEHHVKLGESLEASGRLPVTFMLLQPPSWHPDVWSDVARMLTLNNEQSAKGREAHLCPLQYDIVDRAIEQFSNRGDLVYDPFAGLGTVACRAVMLGRKGLGCELSTPYWLDSATYCAAAERQVAMPDLFAALDAEGQCA